VVDLGAASVVLPGAEARDGLGVPHEGLDPVLGLLAGQLGSLLGGIGLPALQDEVQHLLGRLHRPVGGPGEPLAEVVGGRIGAVHLGLVALDDVALPPDGHPFTDDGRGLGVVIGVEVLQVLAAE